MKKRTISKQLLAALGSGASLDAETQAAIVAETSTTSETPEVSGEDNAEVETEATSTETAENPETPENTEAAETVTAETVVTTEVNPLVEHLKTELKDKNKEIIALSAQVGDATRQVEALNTEIESLQATELLAVPLLRTATERLSVALNSEVPGISTMGLSELVSKFKSLNDGFEAKFKVFGSTGAVSQDVDREESPARPRPFGVSATKLSK